jgi:tRNA pseudouridine55 synthase
MDGLLVIDKPAGPTSHDVVARMRRALGERRIGHTGTLDPAATGVLPLVIGRATRLARFMSAGDKSYLATIRLGARTDTADATGQPIGERYGGPMPSRRSVDAALDAFRGTFLQQPPAFSAKRIAGTRSYALARAAARRPRGTSGCVSESLTLPAPVTVRADALNVIAIDGDTLALEVQCSAGFYVRSLARDLGERLGTGAHLAALRRTRSGDVGLDQAIGLGEAEHDPARAAAAVIPLARLLPHLPSVVLTGEGVSDALHGRTLKASALASETPAAPYPGSPAQHLGSGGCAGSPAQHGRLRANGFVRLLGPTGELIGIGAPGEAPGSLHPAVVLV